MRSDVALLLRVFVHAAALIAGLLIAFIVTAMILIGLFGTGAFTAAPPPEHPAVLGSVVVLAIGIALEVVVVWVWRKLVGAIDKAEAR